MSSTIAQFALHVLLIGPPFLVAILLHEIAHGWVAEKLGDPTARSRGRISLNPLRHIDPMMTVILPALLIWAGSPVVFGGAKPVPVNPLYFRNPRRGMALVAIAGPLVNFALVAISYIALRALAVLIAHGWVGAPALGAPDIAPPGDSAEFWSGQSANIVVLAVLYFWLFHAILVNLVLGLFNLLPVPPLDGGRIVVGILPLRLATAWSKLERYGLLIIFALLYTGVVRKVLGPLLELVAGKLLSGL